MSARRKPSKNPLQALLRERQAITTRMELLRQEQNLVRRGMGPIEDGLMVATFDLADVDRRLEECRMKGAIS